MATSRNLSTYREALRQLNGGIDGNELCVPCKNAIFDDDFARIGTAAWLNDGFPGSEHLDKPALYCCFCRHIIRAREFAKRKGRVADVPNVGLDWVLTGMEQGIFVHDDGADIDGEDGGLLEDFEVEKCGFVRSIQDRWADVARIKSWLEDCEDRHEGACNAHRRQLPEAAVGQLLLVDVQNDCLVWRSFADRYFALSYVWGTSKQFLTLKENFEQLLKPGSMSVQSITQTIKDAMQFVKSLGERYLWVDTVCIIQDDLDNKANAIAQMSSIYSRAVATIIAMSGSSADAGLPGVPPTARNTPAIYIAPCLRLIERTPLERVMNEYTYGTGEYPYNTRAWTFQERLLSNRSIIFLREQVYFQCKSLLIAEDRYTMDYSNSAVFTLDKARTWSQNNKAKNKKYGPLDEFRYYEELVGEYTAKKMGYPEDIINAFVGIQTELGNMFGWTFNEGLPVPLLDLALLWTPVEAVERRPTAPRHPSWGWSGWMGRVQYKDLVRPLHLSVGELFKPLATWELDTPGTIRFDCETVLARAFTMRRCEQRLDNPHYNALVTPDAHFLIDPSGRRCGILYGIRDDTSPSQTTFSSSVELLRLSSWKRANSMNTYGPVIAYTNDGNTHEEELFDSQMRDVESCTYNVMLARWWGAGYERVAVGQIHRDAWAGGEPLRKTIAVQ